MINRVLDMVRFITISKDAIEALKESYEGKNKGSVYYTSLEYQNKKIKDFKDKIDRFGEGKLIHWEVIINTPLRYAPDNIKVLKLILDSSVTSAEIESRAKFITYPDQVAETNVISVKSKEVIIMGFPRIIPSTKK